MKSPADRPVDQESTGQTPEGVILEHEEKPATVRSVRRLKRKGWGRFFVLSACLITLAGLSWFLLEGNHDDPLAADARRALHAIRQSVEDGNWDGGQSIIEPTSDVAGSPPWNEWILAHQEALTAQVIDSVRIDRTLRLATAVVYSTPSRPHQMDLRGSAQGGWRLARVDGDDIRSIFKKMCRERFSYISEVLKKNRSPLVGMAGASVVEWLISRSGISPNAAGCPGSKKTWRSCFKGPSRPLTGGPQEIVLLESPENHPFGGHALRANGDILWLDTLELLLRD